MKNGKQQEKQRNITRFKTNWALRSHNSLIQDKNTSTSTNHHKSWTWRWRQSLLSSRFNIPGFKKHMQLGELECQIPFSIPKHNVGFI